MHLLIDPLIGLSRSPALECPLVHPSIDAIANSSIYPLPTPLSICPPFHAPIYPPTSCPCLDLLLTYIQSLNHLLTHPSIDPLPIPHSSIHPLMHPSSRLHTHASFHPIIHLPTCTPTHPLYPASLDPLPTPVAIYSPTCPSTPSTSIL